MTATPTFTLRTYDNTASEAALRQIAAEGEVPASGEGPMTALLQKGVLVFGGARPGQHASYTEEAAALGTYIAQTLQRPLVYGGGTVGIMGAAAQAAASAGGRVVAIIPAALKPREASGDMIGDLVYTTETMSERKSIMFAHADTVVALPGGVGTFDELLEVITLHQLNAYRPKIGVVNANHFFDPFLQLLRHLIAEGFVEEAVLDMVVVRPTALELMEALRDMPLPQSSTKSLVWNHRP
ncbi:lysine decarboxylase-like protein [Strigomonas culicis]|uniref:Lysine decarboxylase-like protein n=1 Tax=Strigomonas culicis TaxID=28005 RepID=S9VA27_9TRYP|nr:lysine decarboxylase-like protein [Strigomonas culicis]EPY30058.1 lysine decarboxylase-like protein [Strigomonas culicis]|eukprot:EPY23841.1 lysine decarboxylase-like protein [Strigomonas culicis]